MKIIIVLFLLIFLIPAASSTRLSLSPSSIDFSGHVNETICRDLKISVNEPTELELNDHWTDDPGSDRQIARYILENKDLNIKIDYPETLIFEGPDSKTIKICLVSKYPGNYKGALITSEIDGNVAVGSWLGLVILDDPGNNPVSDNFNWDLLTVFSIQAVFLFIVLTILYYVRPGSLINSFKSSN